MARLLETDPVYACDFVVDGICYDIVPDTEGTVAVTSGDFRYVEIPPTVIYNGKTYKVTSIGNWAFILCRRLTSVTIPNSVSSIGNWAFYCCRRLTSVTIPSSVTTIGIRAFSACDSLETINVEPDNAAFCSHDGILYDIDMTTLICCPGKMTTVSIPGSVTTIDECAFRDTSSLEAINVEPDNAAFCSHNGILYDIDMTTLICCPGKKAIVSIPNSVTAIGGGAFWDCHGLKSVTIPNSVTSIGGRAFQSCRRLTSVTIPKSVITIDEQAFYDCSGLTEVNIPNTVTTIGSQAFCSCSGLTAVSIPNSVTSIGNGAFCDCGGLEKIYNQMLEPLTCKPGFSDENYEDAILYVPTGSLEAYINADPWRNFRNIEEMDFSGINGIEADTDA